MTKGDLLRPHLWGRPIKPVALAIAGSLLTVAWWNLVDSDVFTGAQSGDIVGGAALVGAAALLAAWAFRNQRMAEWGLLIASGVWIARSFAVYFTVGAGQIGVALSVWWALVCAGSYLLESMDPDGHAT